MLCEAPGAIVSVGVLRRRTISPTGLRSWKPRTLYSGAPVGMAKRSMLSASVKALSSPRPGPGGSTGALAATPGWGPGAADAGVVEDGAGAGTAAPALGYIATVK